MFGYLTTLFTLVIFMALNYMKGGREMGKTRERNEQRDRVCLCVLVRERIASKR